MDEALRWKELDLEHQILQRGSRRTIDTYTPITFYLRFYTAGTNLAIAQYQILLQMSGFPRACHIIVLYSTQLYCL